MMRCVVWRCEARFSTACQEEGKEWVRKEYLEVIEKCPFFTVNIHRVGGFFSLRSSDGYFLV